MAIWMLFATMTALAVLAVLWPLSRHRAGAGEADPNTQFYRDQLAEIERDRERGLLSPDEAEAARAEAGRRLLRAGATPEEAISALGELPLRRRRAVSALALSLVPILALAVYGASGSPDLPGQPLAARLQANPEQMDLASAIARIESHLALHPDDGRGWDVLAPVYLRMGRAQDAVRAYAAALRILGPEAERLTNFGEAQVVAKDGVVPAEARAAFEQALKLDAGSPKARFYLAQAAEQDGDRDRAKAEYRALLSAAPAGAPWAPVVQRHLARLDGAEGESMPDRQAITGMVEGLAARLEAQGGSAEEWARLMRSYAVLGEHEKARRTLERARDALARDQGGLRTVDAMAQELKLTGSPTP
jgi:cytochrome c-type biogenesis protein CcmH